MSLAYCVDRNATSNTRVLEDLGTCDRCNCHGHSDECKTIDGLYNHEPYMIRYLPPTHVGNGNVLTLVCLSVLGWLETMLCWSLAFSDDLA